MEIKKLRQKLNKNQINVISELIDLFKKNKTNFQNILLKNLVKEIDILINDQEKYYWIIFIILIIWQSTNKNINKEELNKSLEIIEN